MYKTVCRGRKEEEEGGKGKGKGKGKEEEGGKRRKKEEGGGRSERSLTLADEELDVLIALLDKSKKPILNKKNNPVELPHKVLVTASVLVPAHIGFALNKEIEGDSEKNVLDGLQVTCVAGGF
jgi:hypothetical protein